MCPGKYESGGKRLSGKTRKGSRWLRQVLVEAAHVATKTRQTYLAAQYQRLAARRGKKRALIALGHTIWVIVDTLLTRKQPYQGLGTAYFDSLAQQRVEPPASATLGAFGVSGVLTAKYPVTPYSALYFQQSIRPFVRPQSGRWLLVRECSTVVCRTFHG